MLTNVHSLIKGATSAPHLISQTMLQYSSHLCNYHTICSKEHCDVIKPLPYVLRHKVMWLP